MACFPWHRAPYSEQRTVATNAPFISKPGNCLSFVELTSPLPNYQAALNEARAATDWDQQQLNQIVAHERGLLGAFIPARVETVTGETGQLVEYLVSVESDKRGNVFVTGRSPMPASASAPSTKDRKCPH